MPNHFHLALQPFNDGGLSRWMQWLTTSHVRRYHRHYHGSGHGWQDRYKSFPIEADDHLYIVLRYIERNPLRANLVQRAQDWPWSSLVWWRRRDRPVYLKRWAHGPSLGLGATCEPARRTPNGRRYTSR